jgi:hypothetical protein
MNNVTFLSGDYGENNWYGLTECTSWGSYPDCYSKTVRINDERISNQAQPQTQYNKTSCHEMGHVGGLGHRGVETSCMTQGAAPPISEYMDSHDMNELHATYN